MKETKTYCFDCHILYDSDEWLEAVVPNDYWKLISPNGDEGGLLCLSCMRKRFAALGFGTKFPPVPFKLFCSGSMTAVPYDDDAEIDKEKDPFNWIHQSVNRGFTSG